MKYGSIPGIEKPISRLVQGVMMTLNDDVEISYALLDQIYDLGCTMFDTAHIYNDGDVDRVLGGWVNSRGLKDKVIILGKGAHPMGGRKRVTPEDISADIYESLERMQLDHIDLYILHRDDPDVPVGPIIEILNELRDAGRISAFGGSNWSHQRLQAANDYAAEHNLTPFVASSVQFSLAEMVEPPWDGCISVGGPKQGDARDWYKNNQMALIPWSSLAGGFFTGRFTRDNLDTFDDYFDKVCIKGYCYEDNFKRLDRARELAEKKNLTLPQIAIAYVVNQPLNIHALVGCRKKEEFADNIAAMEVELSPEELAWLDLRRDTLN